MDKTLILTVVVTTLSFIGLLGYGYGLMRQSRLKLRRRKKPKRKGVSERFRIRFEGDIRDTIAMIRGNISTDSGSKAVEDTYAS